MSGEDFQGCHTGCHPNSGASRINWINQFLASASIRQKVFVGYALSIGLAILGTTTGLGIGQHYQKSALAELTRAQKQEHLLKNLQIAILDLRSYPYLGALSVMASNPSPSRVAPPVAVPLEDLQPLQEKIDQAQQLLLEAQRFVREFDTCSKTNTNHLLDLLKTYRIIIDSYNTLIQSLLPESAPDDQLKLAQRQLLPQNNPELTTALERFFEQSDQLIRAAQVKQQQGLSALNRADQLCFGIIVSSMIASVAIAILLAIHTSNAIAQRIKSLTEITEQVKQESNFTLQAPVTTRDEVGVLATSLNQLIHGMADYTQELQQTEIQLIQNEKMSSLGTMVAGIAHEMNNPINFIYGNLFFASDYIEDLLSLVELYQQYYPNPDPEIKNRLEEIDLEFLAQDLPKIIASMKGGAERIREIVLSMRNFSRLDEAEIKPVNIHEGIDNTLVLLSNRLKPGIEVIKQYGDLPVVDCYPAQLNQVFLSILENALDAIEQDATEHKAIEHKSVESCPSPVFTIRIQTELVDQNWVVIRIADNGPGIAAAIKDRIFDPFFTTKDPGQGTGLGLAITYQIITQHRGKIEVASEPGQGAEFVISLPR
ncbi:MULTISPECIES: ATP-binding protein [Moorena]|uniref:histidine kinase n=2 Tax=Moorena TaxID=1155738 RepID=F4XZN4_9CYAN|nr:MULTISPECIES: ATP-binding protein [Moorena]EGJ30039.1 integral membrane histidine kinase carbohydrate-selective porin, OprB family [Moorena producens 3L]NEP34347.1 HAMP domain-containing protein [Moorena sp. SIO3B2]NEP64422.1 HAMP domain-containing protein [Moorena sp. SIO3A5]NEQ04764.1 HAMP domain-containing protein [Moorena sp. SIO4E2]NER88753.1 HAMP domain-containing protein [Moorena sp. SIO3A2]